jgi:Asp-tRNA(Asn)/Glu-tRNA(Gln) amidotransferase A subunit family amidase
MESLKKLDATDLAEYIRKKELSARELMEETINRIEH